MVNGSEIANLSDEELVAMVRDKSKELYSELIHRYQTKLTHYLRKFIRDPDELEDVLQEVFIKSYRNLFDFDVQKKFSPWIYRIAHNEAINQIKKYRHESVSLDDFEWEIVDEKIDIKKEVDANLTRARTEVALAKLKWKYREPLILFFFEQKSYDEISDILRLPRNTVGTLISRGKNEFKKILMLESYDYGQQSH